MMHLCMFLAFVLWGSGSHDPMKVVTTTPQKNHRIPYAAIQQELSADKCKSDFPSIHAHSCLQGDFCQPQNTSEVRRD